MVLLPPFDRRPGFGSAAVLLSSWRLSERRQPAAYRMALAGFPRVCDQMAGWPAGPAGLRPS